MTKEEKIKEAWGEYYEEYKNYIDSDGWLDSAWLDDRENDYDVKDGYDRYGTESTFIRPKSLKGIEDNNGWIKIESEEDLPKEEGYYHVIDLNRTEMQLAKFDIHHNIILDYWIKNITHYQPIEKPKPPIY